MNHSCKARSGVALQQNAQSLWPSGLALPPCIIVHLLRAHHFPASLRLCCGRTTSLHDCASAARTLRQLLRPPQRLGMRPLAPPPGGSGLYSTLAPVRPVGTASSSFAPAMQGRGLEGSGWHLSGFFGRVGQRLVGLQLMPFRRQGEHEDTQGIYR